MKVIVSGPAAAFAHDISNHTALMYAQPERLDIVEFLLNQGADLHLRTQDGLTASQEALRQAECERKSIWKNDRPELYERMARLLRQYER